MRPILGVAAIRMSTPNSDATVTRGIKLMKDQISLGEYGQCKLKKLKNYTNFKSYGCANEFTL